MDASNLSDDACTNTFFIPEGIDRSVAPGIQSQAEPWHFQSPSQEHLQFSNYPAIFAVQSSQSLAADGAFPAESLHFPSAPKMGPHHGNYASNTSDDSRYHLSYRQQAMNVPDFLVSDNHASQVGGGHMSNNHGYDTTYAWDLIAQPGYEAILQDPEYGRPTPGYENSEYAYQITQIGNSNLYYPDDNAFVDPRTTFSNLPHAIGNFHPSFLSASTCAGIAGNPEYPSGTGDMLGFPPPAPFGFTDYSNGWATNPPAMEIVTHEDSCTPIQGSPNVLAAANSQTSLTVDTGQIQSINPKLQYSARQLRTKSEKKFGGRIESSFTRRLVCNLENNHGKMTISRGQVTKLKGEKQKGKARKRVTRACLRCQQQKAACDENYPCGECFKIATDEATALRICLRIGDGLVDARNKVSNLFKILSRAFTVGVLMHDFENRGQNPSTRRTLPSRKSCRNTLDLLKPVTQLMEWGPRDLQWRMTRQPRDIEYVLDALLFCYVRSKTKLPMYDLVSEVLKVACLGRFLDDRCKVGFQNGLISYTEISKIMSEIRTDYCKLNLDSPVTLTTAQALFMVSGAISGIQEAESKALKMIDDFLRRSTKVRSWQPPTCDPIILGICVRRLALQYRRVMFLYKGFYPKSTTSYENARSLYDVMTLGYSNIYRKEACPFSPNWKLDEHRDAFGNDEELIEKFNQFKMAEEEHYKINIDEPDDKVYREVFFERKQRRGKRMCDTFSPLSSFEGHETSSCKRLKSSDDTKVLL